jgi:hypothetical protein
MILRAKNAEKMVAARPVEAEYEEAHRCRSHGLAPSHCLISQATLS